MIDRPIIFSGSMVKALLAHRKTQTRRLLKVQPPSDFISAQFGADEMVVAPACLFGSPFHMGLRRLPKPGYRLWVREAWRTAVYAYDDLSPAELGGEETILYEADADWSANKSTGRRRQGIHMPRWASRLTLIVTDVRVQRLQDISDADAIAEGIERRDYAGPDKTYEGDWGWRDYSDHPHAIAEFRKELPRRSYETLWDSLNAKRAPWASNPFVVAYTFTVHKTNIDNMERTAA